MALTKITSDIVESNIQQSGFKNKIIGGDFSTNPWQRGVTFGAVADNTYTADRWVYKKSTDSGIVSILKTQDAPTASQAGIFTQHCLDVDVMNADTSIATGEYSYIEQRIEGINSMSLGFGQAGSRVVSLSFWHKHTKTGSYSVSLSNSALNRSYVATYTQDASNVWEKSEITIPVDTSGTWLYDNGIGLRVRFCIASGSTFQTTSGSWATGDFLATSSQVNGLDNVNNNFKIALVQLEYGNQASMFENRSIGQELQLCERYFEKTYALNVVPGTNTGIGTGEWLSVTISSADYYDFGKIRFQTRKRGAPTFVFYSTDGTMNTARQQDTANIAVSVKFSSETGGSVNASGATTGNYHRIHYTATAEL